MELFINILEVFAFISKVVFSVSIVFLVGCLGVWASDEYKEVRAERSIELARTSGIENFFTPMVEEKRKYEARHRFDKTQEQYRHAPISEELSYLEWASEETRNRVLPVGDEHFFGALLREQKEFAPSW